MEVVITFQTTNRAIQAERQLLDAALDVKVMPLPPAIRAGCGLCLRLPPEQAGRGLRLLADAGVDPEGVYTREAGDGGSVYAPYEK